MPGLSSLVRGALLTILLFSAACSQQPQASVTQQPADLPGAAPAPTPTPPAATDAPTPMPLAATDALLSSPTEPLALPPSDAASARLRVPAGFAVRIFASGLQNPRLMTVGPDEHLYVAERGAGAVIRLPDADDDGLADAREVIATGLNQPHNIEWFDGSLFVAEFDLIRRLTDLNGDGDFADDGEQSVVTDNIPAGGQHFSRTLHFGPDGKLYVAAGSSGNIEPEQDLRRATIMRFNPDGSIPDDNPFVNDPEPTRHPVWAEGLRNSIDFLFLPDGRLWANHNGSDGMGDDDPPEEIVLEIEPGKHYGWPYCFTPTLGATPPNTAEVRDERVGLGRLSSCDQATPALFTDLAHQAPIGMIYYDKTLFPADYQGNLFVAYHGSWNSSVPRDCKVQRIIIRDGLPVESKAFLAGFRDDATQQCGGAWGRPTGLAVGADGALFVADGQNGNIYRVIYGS
ncbi:MAG: PQQ-dependent sugar dehydrogenase [Chloroflexales bacterium]|nr:PQQ-dependent sugar dehydrogenase [Chloroflexales bacterium]